MNRASTSTACTEGRHDSFFGSVSGDGRYVVFESTASDFVASDANGRSDTFVVGQGERYQVVVPPFVPRVSALPAVATSRDGVRLRARVV